MSAALPTFSEQQLKDALSVAFPFDAEPDGSWTLIESERRISEAVIAARDAQWQAYASQARADLEAENKRLRDALIDIKYGLEGARIWGGMEWVYNPLHPFKYLPLIAKAEAALKEQP